MEEHKKDSIVAFVQDIIMFYLYLPVAIVKAVILLILGEDRRKK